MAEVSIIVPVYNEAEHILPFYYELKKHTPKEIELIWVDDGSTDSTLAEIEQLITLDSRIRCISLTRNFGQAAAISAGIDFALAPNIIIMSGDLKNPPALIPKLLAKINEGFEIVNTSSNNTANVFWGQKQLLNAYYKFLDFIAPLRNENDFTAFRAMNIKVSEGIRQLKERNLFLSDFFSWSGYKTATINYNCAKCGKNEKKYSFAHLKRETVFAFKNINTSVFKTLLIASSVSLLAAIYILIKTATANNSFSISSGLITAILFAGSAFLFWKSRINLYLNNNATSAKKAPKYLIKDVIEQDDHYYKMSYELIKH